MNAFRRGTVVAGVASIGLLIACRADLADLRRDQCPLRLNGTCNEPEVCEVGGDAADCHSGPYAACHDLLTGLIHGDRCTPGGDSICMPGSLPASNSVCTRPCMADDECPEVLGFITECKEMNLFGQDLPTRGCAIGCDREFSCPSGMVCLPNEQCVWANDTPKVASFDAADGSE